MREKGILKLLVISVILAIVASSSAANLENCCIEIDEKGIDEGGGKGIVSLLLPFFIGVTGGTVVDFAPQATAHEEETPTPVGSLPYVPTWIEYQGRFVDAEGQPFNGTVNMTFSIYDAAEGGTKLWGPEQHTKVTVSDSIFNVTLGQSERLTSEVLTGATWMEFGINGEVQTPRKNGLYALHASWADTVDGFHVPSPEKNVYSCYVSKNESAEATAIPGNNTSGSIVVLVKNESADATAIAGNNMSGSIDAMRKNESAEATAIVGNDTSGSIGVPSESANNIYVYSTSDANKPAVYMLSIRNIMPEYQDRLVDTEGNRFSGTVNMTFSIYDAAEGGTRLWGPEDHTNVKVSDGFFSVTLRIPSGVLTGATWMEVAANGVVWTPRRSGLYALYASWADNADNADTVDGFHVSSPGPSLDTRYDGRYVNDPHDRMKSKYDTGPILTVTNLGAKGAILGETGADDAYEAAIVGDNTGGGIGVLGTTAAADADVAAIVGNNTGGGYGVLGNSVNNYGVYGKSTNDAGVYGESTNSHGVEGLNSNNWAAVFGRNMGTGTGVEGRSSDGFGVHGESFNGAGVFGENAMGPLPNAGGPGVIGYSAHYIGVVGLTKASDPDVAAVEGNNTGGGIGVYGTTGSNQPAIYGYNTAPLNAPLGGGPGVKGHSDTTKGILGTTNSPSDVVAAIEGHNMGGGMGVYGRTGANEPAVYGENTGKGAGVSGSSKDGIGVHVVGAGDDGMCVDEAGVHGVHVNKTKEDGVHVDNAGDDGFQVAKANDDGIYVGTTGGNGISIFDAGSNGIAMVQANGAGVFVGKTIKDSGFRVNDAAIHGLHVKSANVDGVYINKAGNNGISINNAGLNGVAIAQANSVGVFVGKTNENDGFRVNNAGNHGLYVEWANVDGVHVKGASDDAYHACSPHDDAFFAGNPGGDGLDMRAVGGNYIVAGPPDDRKFRVDKNGGVHTDTGFWCGAGAPGCPKPAPRMLQS